MKITIEPTMDQTNRSAESRFFTVSVGIMDNDDLSYDEVVHIVTLALDAWGYPGLKLGVVDDD